MKAHTNDFKNKIKLMGKEIDSKITFGNAVLGKNELNAVTPSFQGAILKSVMKELHIDSNIEIPVGITLNYQFGLKVGNSYEYIDYGNFVVKEVENKEDTNSYLIKAYDKMLYSMKPYESIGATYPITIRNYMILLSAKLGLNFANATDTFANYDKIISNELYLSSDGTSIDYTFRDVFDELSQVTASTICINENDEVEIRYINDTNDTIDEEYLKDVNVNFGEKYGKINSIVLSRSGESDNVYLRDEESVTENGLCELKIIDNQIMNFNNRSDYLPDILEKLNGVEYYLNDFTSTGIIYYDVCDKYSVKIGDKTYSCVMFNDEINITQGLEEIVYTEMPPETQTNYTKADKTDRKINQTYIIVDKQNQEIQSLASKIIELSTTKTGKGQIKFESATLGALDKLSITGNVHLIYPSSDKMGGMEVKSGIYKSGMTKSSTYKFVTKALYPSNNLYPLDTYLIIKQEDKEVFRKRLPIKELNSLDNISDEFVWQYNKMKIIRRIGVATNGDYYVLPNEFEEDLGELEIIIPEGDGYFVFESFPNSTISITYMLKNEYTETFSTKVETKAGIKLATDEINIGVEQKFYDYNEELNGNELISRINLSPGTAKIEATKLAQITADKINLEGYTTINEGFSVDLEGNATMNDVTINGGDIILKDAQNKAKMTIIDENNSNVKTTYGSRYIKMINEYGYGLEAHNSNFNQLYLKSQNGGFIDINNDNSRNYIQFRNSDKNERLDIFNSSSGNSIILEDYPKDIELIMSSSGSGDGNPYFKVSKGSSFSSMSQNGVWSPGFNNNSLESKKKNIEIDNGCLQEILNTDICSYNWNFEDDEDQKHIGLIIPDKGGNYKISSKALTHDKDAVDLYSMVGMAWKSIQELYDIIKEKDNKIKELEEQLNGVK